MSSTVRWSGLVVVRHHELRLNTKTSIATSSRVRLNMYLMFLVGPSWLSELSWQSGRSAESWWWHSWIAADENKQQRRLWWQERLWVNSESVRGRRRRTGPIYAGWVYCKLSPIWCTSSCVGFDFYFQFGFVTDVSGLKQVKTSVCVLNVAEGKINCVQTHYHPPPNGKRQVMMFLPVFVCSCVWC